jgi:hypothetical protein
MSTFQGPNFKPRLTSGMSTYAATIPASQVPTRILAQMTASVVNESKRYAIAALSV